MKKLFFISLLCLNIITYSNNNFIRNGQRDFFIENKGQWPGHIRYHARLKGYNLWIDDYKMILDFKTDSLPLLLHFNTLTDNTQWISKDPYETFFHYILGNDSTHWAFFVHPCKEALAFSKDKNIITRFYFEKEKPRFDFILSPNNKTNKIVLKISNHDLLTLKDNKITIAYRQHKLVIEDLHAFQYVNGIKKEVKCTFSVQDDRSIFIEPENFDPRLTLYIDPAITTWLDGDNVDIIRDMYVDNNGVYVCGQTLSGTFPSINGTIPMFQYLKGPSDAFLTRFTPDLYSVNYSIFIGGKSGISNNSGNDAAMALKVKNNLIYLTGVTNSCDSFPKYPLAGWTHPSVADNQCGAMAFLTVISPGSPFPLYFSGIYGEPGINASTNPIDVIVTDQNQVVFGGFAQKNNLSNFLYPYTSNSLQNFNILNSTPTNGIYGFMLALDVSLNPKSIVRIGGNQTSIISKLHYANNQLFFCGNTKANNFPVSSNAFQTQLSGPTDAFFGKLNYSTTNIFDLNQYYLSYLGGNAQDSATDILFHNGKLYVSGETYSNDFPTTDTVFKKNKLGPGSDGFLSGFTFSGNNYLINKSTFYGSNNYNELIVSIDTGLFNSIIFTGLTKNGSDLATLPNAVDVVAANDEITIGVTNAKLSHLIYHSFLGGNNADNPEKIQTYKNNVYITGNSKSGVSFPFLSVNSFQNTNSNSPIESFVTRLYDICGLTNPIGVIIIPDTSAISMCPFDTLIALHFPGNVSGSSIVWSGTNNIVNFKDTLQVINSGWHSVIYTYTYNGLTCSSKDSILVNLKPSPDVEIIPNTPVVNLCKGDSLHLSLSSDVIVYGWGDSTGLVNTNLNFLIPNHTGWYIAYAYNAWGCPDVDTVFVNLKLKPVLNSVNASPVCFGDTVYLNINAQNTNAYTVIFSNNSLSQPNGTFVISSNEYANDSNCVIILKNTNGCETKFSYILPFYPQPDANYSGDTTVCKNKEVSILVNTDADSIAWGYNNSSNDNPLTFTATNDTLLILHIYKSQCKRTIEIPVSVLDETACVLNIYTSFSPNGDGVNDYWHIDGIDLFNDVIVEIFNRWGVQVWSTNNYDNASNSFKGETNEGKPLPNGTYYYIIKRNDQPVLKGYLEILR